MSDDLDVEPITPPEPPSRADQVAEAMGLLGAAWRGDWSDFDGRTLRAQLDELIAALQNPDDAFDVEAWAFTIDICPEAGAWVQNCPDRPPAGSNLIYTCAHKMTWTDKLHQETTP